MVRQEIPVPDLGEGGDEGELVAWLVEPGDHVESGHTVAEIETDKALIEVETDREGEVVTLHAEEGAVVGVGDPLVTLEVAAGAGEREAGGAQRETEAGSTERDVDEAEAGERPPAGSGGRVFAPPRVRRIAREEGVDITAVAGSGPGGRITETDVREVAEKNREAAEEKTEGPREFVGGTSAVTKRGVSTDSTRETTAATSDEETPAPRSAPSGEPAVEPATESGSDGSTASIGQSVHHDEADVTELLSVRDRLALDVEAEGTSLSALPFAIAAVSTALGNAPSLNGPVIDGTLDRREGINVAIGVPTPDGLACPVIVDADDASVRELAREADDLIERARSGDLDDVETADATFTVTDFGALGGTYASPDVSAIGTSTLALGAIRSVPRVHENEVVPRDVVGLSTAVPSESVDGTVAAQFTNEVRRYLTEPALLLLE